MANRIADELLKMIIAPSLHVSDDRFSSVSNTAFGCNVNFPSSSVLLVCKKWLRIATPLLYKVVVLRSTAQAQAIVEAFSRNPKFPLYVKKIRLEGAYSCLWDVFRRCSNLHTLCFTLDIYAAVTATGLCRSLLSINPTRVILRDQSETKNVKIERVFCKLLECIPLWTNLTEFHFPYSQTNSALQGSKPERLAIALSESTTLTTISADLPLSWDDTWSTLATNPNIVFKFRENQPRRGAGCYRAVLTAIFKDPEIMRKMDVPNLGVILSKVQANLERPSDKTAPKPSFTPFAMISSSTAEALWTRIFAFAASPGHPDSFNISNLTGNRAALGSVNSTRKSLTLVSKQFHLSMQRLSQQFLFTVPLLLKERSLTRLVLRCSQDLSILHQVRVLSLYMLLGSRNSSDVDFELTVLIPHLIGLRHFIGSTFLSISSGVFALLAETAGQTLITIRHLSIASKDAVPHTTFAHFRKLNRIHFARCPQVIITDTSQPPSKLLPNLKGLVSASLPRDMFMRSSLRICGARLLNLEVTPGNLKYFDLLRLCPRLRVLKWTGYWDSLSELLSESSAHSQLVKINLCIPRFMITKDVMSRSRKFFPALFLALREHRLPSLREINISGYTWPIEERDIEKDAIVEHALEMRLSFSDVNITDEGGHAWRIRAKRRK